MGPLLLVDFFFYDNVCNEGQRRIAQKDCASQITQFGQLSNDAANAAAGNKTSRQLRMLRCGGGARDACGNHMHSEHK